MEVSLQKRHLLIFAALTAASILIFQISVVFFLFTVPLYVIMRKYGFQYISMAAFFVAVVLVTQTVIRGSGIEGSSLRRFLITLELLYPLSLLGGILVISYFKHTRKVVFLLLVSSAGFYLITVPIILHYSGNNEIVSLLKDQIVYVADMFSKGAGSADSFDNAVLLKELQPERIVVTTAKLILRNYVFAYFIMLTVSWYLADAVLRRMDKRPGFKLVNFRVPEILLWVLLISLVGVLADLLVELSWIGYLMWNSTFIMVLIYGIHGIGLIGYLLGRYKVTRNGRRFFMIIAVAVLLVPGINLVILIGVPVLGISEHWIRYR